MNFIIHKLIIVVLFILPAIHVESLVYWPKIGIYDTYKCVYDFKLNDPWFNYNFLNA